MTYKLPPLPFAVFDEFGKSCEDRVRDHFIAALEQQRQIEAQCVPRVIANIKHDKLGHPYATMRTAYDDEGNGLKDGAALVLASTPPAPQPLSEEQIAEIAMASGAYDEQLMAFARAIEQAHGITKE